MLSVLVTGSSGYVGTALVKRLYKQDIRTITVARKAQQVADIHVASIDAKTNWHGLLHGIDVVIHLAAIVHQPQREDKAYYLDTNAEGTRVLAEQAAQQGVKRFIFLSSIKVNGEQTKDQAFTESDPPHCRDGYAYSKWKAEQYLWQIASETAMEIVIIRPPLIYGPNAKGNLLKLLQAADRQWPLPLGWITSKRSLVSLNNLCAFIIECIDHPKAANQLYLLADVDLSAGDLYRLIAAHMQKKVKLISVPTLLLRLSALLIGKQQQVSRMTQSLVVKTDKVRHQLGWRAPYSSVDGLAEMVAEYNNNKQG